MDPERKSKYEALLRETKGDIGRIEQQIEKELAAIKERLHTLQEEKKAQLTIYGGYCTLRGIPNDLESDDDEE